MLCAAYFSCDVSHTMYKHCTDFSSYEHESRSRRNPHILRIFEHRSHTLPGQTLEGGTKSNMSPHHEILDEVTKFGDDSVEILSFICAEIPRITRSDDCPCLWCTRMEDNPLIVFDDLQKQMLSDSCASSCKDDLSTNVSTGSLEGDRMPHTKMISTPSVPILNSPFPSTPTQMPEFGERHQEQQAPNTWTPNFFRPPPPPHLASCSQRKSISSKPIDQYAILAKEIQKREEQRAILAQQILRREEQRARGRELLKMCKRSENSDMTED